MSGVVDASHQLAAAQQQATVLCGELAAGGVYSLNHFLMLAAFSCEVSLGTLMTS